SPPPDPGRRRFWGRTVSWGSRIPDIETVEPRKTAEPQNRSPGTPDPVRLTAVQSDSPAGSARSGDEGGCDDRAGQGRTADVDHHVRALWQVWGQEGQRDAVLEHRREVPAGDLAGHVLLDDDAVALPRRAAALGGYPSQPAEHPDVALRHERCLAAEPG